VQLNYRYPDVDLIDLDRRFGREFMGRIHIHSALFEINKIASLRPHVLDLGPYAHHHTEALERHCLHERMGVSCDKMKGDLARLEAECSEVGRDAS
jgi:hypothetical protein